MALKNAIKIWTDFTVLQEVHVVACVALDGPTILMSEALVLPSRVGQRADVGEFAGIVHALRCARQRHWDNILIQCDNPVACRWASNPRMGSEVMDVAQELYQECHRLCHPSQGLVCVKHINGKGNLAHSAARRAAKQVVGQLVSQVPHIADPDGIAPAPPPTEPRHASRLERLFYAAGIAYCTVSLALQIYDRVAERKNKNRE